jgi:starch synthase (maltosyl-transferring)
VVNCIRRDNPALQQNLTLRFHETSNDDILCHSKWRGAMVLTIVTDPHNTQAGYADLRPRASTSTPINRSRSTSFLRRTVYVARSAELCAVESAHRAGAHLVDQAEGQGVRGILSTF